MMRAIALPHDKTQTLTNSREAASKCFSTSSRARHGPDAASASPISTSSVSSSEVDHFSRLASSWWDPHGPSRLLHLMNPLRFDFLQSLFTQDHTANQQRTYLDVGCGGGIFASACARHPGTSSVLAIDPTPACVAVAQAHQRRDPAIQPPKLTYLNTALENIPEDKNGNRQTFDVITLFEVIEHISSPAAFLQNAAEHLKPGGWLVGSTIARSPVSYITTKLVAEAPLVGVVPAGTHDWNQYINPDELRGWFEKQTESAAVGGPGAHRWGSFTTRGVIYVPALGWKVVQGSESYGNYFFAAQKLPPLST
ncbi:3-demethylubiquinone-9 3-O-methyltransferase [Cyphellophora europaea CBS 101466]|uniref:Ubiquinone biosynthesis O-methyltransferase, mitochondrial n=1 Tax=Cyphellophora europaea (strain CBS 101466) TaxID=1220924 RepID=W2S8U2_CYPE1|nr:3-demethylubiquinone-9 3-O-methyltransferase [Cyphellophora europaea CBS 101466]ETN44433.1 3-demethylubiquinone-9 3-O-methyltransferase [Cyphellophora europaea CBS 101466]